jgi:acetyltransferase-like isoleucine patch superfamily enzyme
MRMYARVGKNCKISEDVTLGLKYKEDCKKAAIGDNAVIRLGTIIYGDVEIGDNFKTGHLVLIREKTKIGNMVVIGSNTVIDGWVEIGDFVKIESNVYIPTHTKIGSYVFIGPGAVLTNDKYPQRLRDEYEPEGPIIEDSVTIGANATILPGIKIEEGSFVAAGSVVTKDVPPWNLAIGVPAIIKPLPEKLKERNRAKRW